MSARVWLATGLLLLAADAARAARIDLALASADDGQELARQSVEIGPGEEHRLLGHGGPGATFELSLAMSVRDEGEDHITIDLHARAHRRGSPAPRSWTQRSYTLGRGEAVSFAITAGAAGEPRFLCSASWASLALPGTGERAPFTARLALSLVERGAATDRVVERRHLELRGNRPTAVDFVLPGGGKELRLRITPGPGRDGRVRLEVEAAREWLGRERLAPELGPGDELRISGLESDTARFDVVLSPRR